MATLKSLNIDGDLIQDKGTASKTYETGIVSVPQIGTSVQYSANAVSTCSSTFNIAEGKIVHVYRDDIDGGKGKCVVGTPSGDSIVWGTPVQFSASTSGSGSAEQGTCVATVNGTSKVVLVYGEGVHDSGMPSSAHKGTSKVGTVSGTGASATISFGSETLITPDNYTFGDGWGIDSKSLCSDTDGNRVILEWEGHARLGTPMMPNNTGLTCVKNGTTTVTCASTAALSEGRMVAGTGITTQTYVASVTNSTTFELSQVATDSGTHSLTFTDRPLGWVSAGTVSGTTVTWHTPRVFEPPQPHHIHASSPAISFPAIGYDTTAQKFVIAWSSRGHAASPNTCSSCRVGTIQGDHSIILGPHVIRHATVTELPDIWHDSSAGKTIVMSEHATYPGGMIACGTISGTGTSATITFGPQARFTSASTYTTQGIYDSNSNQSLITWSGWVRSATVSGTNMVLGPEVNASNVLNPQSDPGGIIYDPVSKKIAIIRNSASGSVTGTVLHFNGNVLNIDLSTGSFFEIDLANYADSVAIGKIIIANVNASSNQISSFTLKITQTSPAKQIVWNDFKPTSTIKWIASTAPTLSTTNDAVDILSFTTYDEGTTWHGKVVGLNFT